METGTWLNTGMNGQPKGYTSYKVGERKYWLPFVRPTSIFRIEMDPRTPLTFVHPGGYALRTLDRVFESDWGTIPRLAQIWFPATACPCSVLFHDNACDRHGFYVSYCRTREGQWIGWFRETYSRLAVDRFFREMVQAEGAKPCEAAVMYGTIRAAVRVGLASNWGFEHSA